MKLVILLGVVSLSAGCSGTALVWGWPKAVPPGHGPDWSDGKDGAGFIPIPASTEPLLEPASSFTAQDSAAMAERARFTNLKDDRFLFDLERVSHPLPRSLLDPWRGLRSSNWLSSVYMGAGSSR